MKKIFIFTAGNLKAQKNLDISIKNSIDKELVYRSFPNENHAELDKIYMVSSGFYAWGATPAEGGKKEKNKSTWERMTTGDYVICVYEKTYHFISSMITKFNNVRFAENVWGYKYADGRIDNPTWQYMYFLNKPKKINVQLSSVNSYLNSHYQGFCSIGKEKLNKIISDFESTDKFIQEYFGNGFEDPPPYLPTKKDFEMAYGMLAALGQEVSIEKVLDQIEIILKDIYNLKDNWREITRRNILEIWSK